MEKTHCKRGHEYTTDSTGIDSAGNKYCKICRVSQKKTGPKPRIPTCHPDRKHCANGLCRTCYIRNHMKTYVYPNPERRDKVHGVCSRRRNANLKLVALTHYGPNGILQCCWEGCTVIDVDMLTLDHVNDDGYKHRLPGNKNRIGGDKLYFWAIKNNFPPTLQTMCANHQLKKKIEKFRRDRESQKEVGNVG